MSKATLPNVAGVVGPATEAMVIAQGPKLELRRKGSRIYLNDNLIHIFPRGTIYKEGSGKCRGMEVALCGAAKLEVPVGRTDLYVYELVNGELFVARGTRVLTEYGELERTIDKVNEQYNPVGGMRISSDFI